MTRASGEAKAEEQSRRPQEHLLLDEAGLADKLWIASLLSDLKKAYESVSHRKLVEEAADNGFPSTVLQLALMMYRAPRRVQFDRSLSKAATVQQGLVAGCSHAIRLLKCFCFDIINFRYNFI